MIIIFYLGIIVAGYGSGQIRIFSVPDGDIVAEIDAHAGWITGMDLASQTGRLVTTAEDGIVRVSLMLCIYSIPYTFCQSNVLKL